MFTSFQRRDLVLCLLLAGLMFATRGHHFASALHLPDASNAIFFLAGFLLSPALALPLLLLEAMGIDYVAITWGGVSSFCVSPAYLLLLPSFGTLWLAGRWCGKRFAAGTGHFAAYAGAALLATAIAELLASGGFYFFSGRFAEPNFAGLLSRLVTYAPPVFASAALWLGLAALLHLALAARRRAKDRDGLAG